MNEHVSSTSFGGPDALRLLLRMALLALLCAALQAILPRYEIGADKLGPLSVVLGIAVAAAAARGRWMVPAALIGAAGAEWATGVWFKHAVLDVTALAAQATLAGWLLRHDGDPQSLNLDTWPRLRRFALVVAPAVAALGVAMHTTAIALFAPAAARSLPVGAAARFVADWTGIVVAAPVLLCWLARAVQPWRHRRGLLALPIVVVSAMMLIGFAEVARRDEFRLKVRFDRDAEARYRRVEADLPETLDTVEAVRDALITSDGHISGSLFDELAAGWVARWPGIIALGWFDAAAKGGLEVADRSRLTEPAVGADALAADSATYVLRHLRGTAVGVLAPFAGANRSRIDALSVPAIRRGVTAALATPRAAVSAPFALDAQGRTGVLLLRALATSSGATQLALAVVDVDRQLSRAMVGDEFVTMCLTDVEKGIAYPRLAGSSGCELTKVDPEARMLNTRLGFGDRRLNLLVLQSAEADARTLPAVWLLALPTVIGLAVLSTLLLDISGRLRRIEDRVRERTLALQAEVDERRRTEQALAESEQRFRAIFDAVNIGVTLVDNDGRIVMANPAFRDLTGYGDDELSQRPLADIRLPDVAADDGTATALAGNFGRRQRYLTRDGRVLQVAASVHALRDATGNQTGTVGALRDLTEMLRLRDAERETEHAQAANRAKSEFLARLSHELRAPLNAIVGFAQSLSSTDDSATDFAETQRALTQIRQAGWHLLDMVNDVLDLSRIEAGDLKLAPQPLSLAEAAHEALGMVEPIAQQADVRVRLKLHEDATIVQADPVRLRQVLVNLLGNAIKYNRRGGFVELRSMPDAPGMVSIDVEDNGIGMSESQLAALFTPFNRLGRERSDQPGTGIGLVICRRLIEAMGGEISVVSREGEGSTFSFRLPRGRAAQPEASAVRVASVNGALHSSVSIGRVVYAEDSAADAEVMRALLRERPGVELVCVRNAAQAQAQAASADLMLVDLNLPDRSGLELLRALKADPHTEPIPVIMVSAEALPARIDECIDAGALNYLTKPLDAQQLLRAVDDALRAI